MSKDWLIGGLISGMFLFMALYVSTPNILHATVPSLSFFLFLFLSIPGIGIGLITGNIRNNGYASNFSFWLGVLLLIVGVAICAFVWINRFELMLSHLEPMPSDLLPYIISPQAG